MLCPSIEGDGHVSTLRKMAFVAAMAVSVPAAAQQAPANVSAADPQGIVELMRFAGYEAELSVDDVGDPQIDTQFSGLTGTVMFYGCDERTHERCDSVQLRVGLDRANPLSLDWLNTELANDRFYAVHLDDEGDPWFNWDIMTGRGEGIPSSVFLLAVRQFATQVGAASDMVFAEERGQVGSDAPLQKEGDTV